MSRVLHLNQLSLIEFVSRTKSLLDSQKTKIMKTQFLILVWVLWGTTVLAQTEFPKLLPPPFDSLSGKIKYSDDIPVLSADFITTKEELFTRALSWFKYDFPSTFKYAVQFQDKEIGKIVAKALIYYSFGPGTGDPYSLRERMERQHEYIEFTISIHVKDGGYNYSMTDFNPLIKKVGSQIAEHGFPEKLINQPSEGVDSVKLKRGNYNLTYEMIARTAEDRISSLKKAMANESPSDSKVK